jgi:site-specific DNA recombinase
MAALKSEETQMKAAIYARYSTDMQSKESIADQHRVCERLAEQHGFAVVSRFSDAAISGGTTQRPGYQDMLRAARDRAFDVIVAEDTSRLWRNLAEQSPRLAELSDLGIAVVTHDLDTRHESAEIMGAVGGAMASSYRKEIGRRVRRGLEGLARNGKSAGGRSYGYVPASKSGTGQIEIDPEQAAVVRRIFEMFAIGHSPRTIAGRLNHDGVPSPGASWSRESRRKRGWVASAIYGDTRRGTGILANPMYIGQVIWNRTRWIRSATDSSKRRQVANPSQEWISRQEERLRVVTGELWQRAKSRQSHQSAAVGERVKRGMSKDDARRTGAGPKFLLSSLLQCAHCGSSFAIAGRDVYACSGYTSSGGTLCTNDALLRRHAAETEVLAGIKRQMLSPEIIDEFCRRARAQLRKPSLTAIDHQPRIDQLKGEIENIVDAIASGVLRPSPALATRLASAEAEASELEAAQVAVKAPAADVTLLLAELPGRARQAVKNLERTLAAGDVTGARQEIRDKVGIVTVDATTREIRLFSERGHIAAALLRVGIAHASLFGSGGRI